MEDALFKLSIILFFVTPVFIITYFVGLFTGNRSERNVALFMLSMGPSIIIYFISVVFGSEVYPSFEESMADNFIVLPLFFLVFYLPLHAADLIFAKILKWFRRKKS